MIKDLLQLCVLVIAYFTTMYKGHQYLDKDPLVSASLAILGLLIIANAVMPTVRLIERITKP